MSAWVKERLGDLTEGAVKGSFPFIDFDLAGHVDEPFMLRGVVGLGCGLSWHGSKYSTICGRGMLPTKPPPHPAQSPTG